MNQDIPLQLERVFMLHVSEEHEAFRNASLFFLIQCFFYKNNQWLVLYVHIIGY